MGSLLELLTSATSLVSGGAFIATLASVIATWLAGRSKIEGLNVELKALEARDQQPETTTEYVTRLLLTAADRRQLSMYRSERRANVLFRIGTGLMVLSVLVPFLLVLLYFQQTPSSELQKVIQLGVAPKDAVSLMSRDWHLLVAGVSFGLLFLAAAKGLLNAEARQRHVHDSQEQIVEAYADIIRGLAIAARLDNSAIGSSGPSSSEAVRRTARLLLEAGTRQTTRLTRGDTSDSAEDEDLVLIKQMMNAIKK